MTSTSLSSDGVRGGDTGGGGMLPGGFHAFNPQADFSDNQITNTARPLTDVVITVRVIKSFEFRSMKAYVLPHVDLTTTTIAQLEETCRNHVRTSPAFKPFRSYADSLTTLKLYTKAHGSKTTNLIINLDHPEWILEPSNLPALIASSANQIAPPSGEERTKHNTTLAQIGLENEAELSFFNMDAYTAFLSNPNTRWDASG